MDYRTGIREPSRHGLPSFCRHVDVSVRDVLGAVGITFQADVAPKLPGRPTREGNQPGPRSEASQCRIGRPGQRGDVDGEAGELESRRCDPPVLLIPPMRMGDAAVELLAIIDGRAVRGIGLRRFGWIHREAPFTNHRISSTAIPTSAAGKLCSSSIPSSGCHRRYRIESGDSNSSSNDRGPARHSSWSVPPDMGTTRGRGANPEGSRARNERTARMTAGSIAGAPYPSQLGESFPRERRSVSRSSTRGGRPFSATGGFVRLIEDATTHLQRHGFG
jgi:hypothetical protein